MDTKSFSRLVLADAMQRHDEICTDWQRRVDTARSELSNAKSMLERAESNRKAFRDFVRDNLGGSGNESE